MRVHIDDSGSVSARKKAEIAHQKVLVATSHHSSVNGEEGDLQFCSPDNHPDPDPPS